MNELYTWVLDFLKKPIIMFADSNITIMMLIYLLIISGVMVYITAKIKNLIIYRLLAKSTIELGVRVAVASIMRYLLLVIGFIVIL